MNSRKQARQVVAQFIQAGIPQLQAVYASPPVTFGGLSPIATVHSDGTRLSPGATFAQPLRDQALIVTLFWRLNPGAEDGIDDLSEQVINLLDANGNQTANWSGLALDEPFSLLGQAEDDKIAYRWEQIRVIVW